MRDILVPGLYEDGKHPTGPSPYIGDGEAVLVGMPRLRQLRVKKGTLQYIYISCINKVQPDIAPIV